jgi:hypothetical protein
LLQAVNPTVSPQPKGEKEKTQNSVEPNFGTLFRNASPVPA